MTKAPAADSSLSLPLPMADPGEVGLCPKRLQRVTDRVNQLIDERTIPGAITLVARRGRIVHFACAGMMDVDKAQPMREDTLFRYYSMTKPIACVATLMLYEKGAFSLQDPVCKFLPEFANLRVRVARPNGTEEFLPPRRPVNLHDLLNHTGGLTYEIALTAEAQGLDLPAFITAFSKVPLSHQPGEKWQYSSSNDVLGRIVEVVSGRPLDVFFAEHIFQPLGMADTGFFVPPEKHDRLTAIYEHDAQGRIIPKKQEDFPYVKKPVFLSAGSALVGSTLDYLRFALMLLGGGQWNGQPLLSRKTIELMRQDHLPPGHPGIEPYKFGYGYGVSVVRSLAEKQAIASVGEFGWGGAACTNTWIDPAEDMICMFMTQVKGIGGLMIDHRLKVLFTQAIAD